MAARKTRGVDELPDNWKERIKAGVIMDRLCKHINGKIEMSPTQINAAKIVLGKTVPDIARQEITGKDGGKIEMEHSMPEGDKAILARFINQQKGQQ